MTAHFKESEKKRRSIKEKQSCKQELLETVSDNRKGSIYYIKLPKTPRYGADDFVIEDYFSKEYKKTVAQAFLDNTGDDFNSLPKDLKQKVKDMSGKKEV